MASYREALAALLADERKEGILRLLADKGELSFALIRSGAKVEHNQTLSRDLDRLEDLGLVHHVYRHGSPQVYSFYALTAFGREMVGVLKGLEEAPVLKVRARRRR